MKALFSLNTLFDTISLDILDKLKLFDSLVIPIFNYGSEVLEVHLGVEVESLHLKSLKQLLGVHQSTARSARLPMYVMRQIRMIKHWYRATKQPESLMYKMMYLTGKNGTLINSWSTNVVNLLSRLGLVRLWNIRNV